MDSLKTDMFESTLEGTDCEFCLQHPIFGFFFWNCNFNFVETFKWFYFCKNEFIAATGQLLGLEKLSYIPRQLWCIS